MPVQTLLVGALVPLALGLVLALALRFAGARATGGPGLAALGALAGLGLYAGIVAVAMGRFPALSLADSTARMALAALGAAALGLVVGAIRPRVPVAGALTAVAAAAGAGLTILPRLRDQWSAGGSAAFLLLFALAALVTALPLLILERSGRPRVAAVVFAGLALAWAGVLAPSGTLRYAQYAAAVALALLPAALLLRSSPRLTATHTPPTPTPRAPILGPGAILAGVTALAALAAAAHQYLGDNRPPAAAFVLLPLVPLGAILAALIPAARRRTPLAFALRVALAAGIAAAGVAAAGIASEIRSRAKPADEYDPYARLTTPSAAPVHAA